jgi:dynein heavy chain 1
MNTLDAHAEEWLALLPATLSSPPSEHSPLARFFAREASTGQKLLKRIRQDLGHLRGVCAGEIKQTNELRALMSDLNKGERLYSTPGIAR